MKDDMRCECGHVNPVGTVLCEACGRMLADNQGEKNYWICAMKAVQDGRKLIINQ